MNRRRRRLFVVSLSMRIWFPENVVHYKNTSGIKRSQVGDCELSSSTDRQCIGSVTVIGEFVIDNLTTVI